MCIRDRAETDVELAAENAPNLCVVAGPNDALDALERRLATDGVLAKRLVTSHAFHSAMMAPAIDSMRERLRTVTLSPVSYTHLDVYKRQSVPGAVGVFGGMYNATYYQRHVLAHPELIARLGEMPTMLANEKDYLTSRTAHRLGLDGPAVSVHTACSTSPVSYTHLDVYKRQAARSAAAAPRRRPRPEFHAAQSRQPDQGARHR